MVLAARGTHEHGPAAERALDDLEPEDPSVELRGRRRVAHVEHRVIEARDRDAHQRAPVDAGSPDGAPTSFQPDCHVPLWTMLRAMFRKASASS